MEGLLNVYAPRETWFRSAGMVRETLSSEMTHDVRPAGFRRVATGGCIKAAFCRQRRGDKQLERRSRSVPARARPALHLALAVQENYCQVEFLLKQASPGRMNRCFGC